MFLNLIKHHYYLVSIFSFLSFYVVLIVFMRRYQSLMLRAMFVKNLSTAGILYGFYLLGNFDLTPIQSRGVAFFTLTCIAIIMSTNARFFHVLFQTTNRFFKDSLCNIATIGLMGVLVLAYISASSLLVMLFLAYISIMSIVLGYIVILKFRFIKSQSAHDIKANVRFMLLVLIAFAPLFTLDIYSLFKIIFLQDTPVDFFFIPAYFFVWTSLFLVYAFNFLLNKAPFPVYLSVQTELITQKKLTEQERKIMDLAINGLSNDEIGDRLFISTATVKKHLQNIYAKMEVKNKLKLIHKIYSQT